MVRPEWFVRRPMGFGVRPLTWQGWAISGVALALIAVSLIALRKSVVGNVVVVGIAIAYLGVAYTTGGAQRAPVPGGLEG